MLLAVKNLSQMISFVSLILAALEEFFDIKKKTGAVGSLGENVTRKEECIVPPPSIPHAATPVAVPHVVICFRLRDHAAAQLSTRLFPVPANP